MSKLQQLKELSKAVPSLNQQAQRRTQAAAGVALQEAIHSTPTTGAVTPTAQKLSAKHTTATGQAAAAAQQRTQQQQGQIRGEITQREIAAGKQRLQARSIAEQEQLDITRQIQQLDFTKAEIANKKKILDSDLESAARISKYGIEQDNRISFMTQKQRKDLAKLGADLEQKLHTDRLRFARDERGRKFANERQMADYALLKAERYEDFLDYAQTAQQANTRHLQLLEHLHKKIVQGLAAEYKKAEGEKDFEHQKALLHRKQSLENEMRKRRQASEAKSAQWSAAANIAAAGGKAFAGGS